MKDRSKTPFSYKVSTDQHPERYMHKRVKKQDFLSSETINILLSNNQQFDGGNHYNDQGFGHYLS